jgi:hypothetical protein
MVVELREQLHVRERGLNKQESALVAREDDVVDVERALERACMECDVEHDQVEASDRTIVVGCMPLPLAIGVP